MNKEEILKITLVFGTQAGKLQVDLDKLAARFVKLQKEAELAKADLKALEGTSFSGAAEERLKSINAAMEETAERARKAKQEMENLNNDKGGGKLAYTLRDVGEKLNQVGQVLSGAGMAINNTLMGAVNAYLQAGNQYSTEAQKWNAAQKEMENAYVRIGAVAIDKLTPLMETAADFLDKLATFIEKNPVLVEAAAKAGIALAAAGEIAKVAGTISMFVGAAKDIAKLAGAAEGASQAGGMAKLLPGLLTNPVAIGAAALGAGAGLGNLAANAGGWLGAKATGQEYDWQTAGDNIQTIQQSLSGSVGVVAMIAKDFGMIDQDTAANIFQTAKSIVGLGDAAKAAGEKVEGAKSPFDDKFLAANVQDFIAYQKQLEDAQNQYKDQVTQIETDTTAKRLDIIAQFGQQAADSESRYTQSRLDAIAKFAQSQSDAETAYYRERANAAKSYGVEVRRMEEDHQRKMRQLAAEHNARMGDLADARDALGLVKEQDAYEKSRRDEEDNYQTEARRKSEDFARQMADMEANFRIQQDLRQRDFAQQQAAADAQHVIELATLEKNKNDQLKALEDGQKKQLDKLKAGLEAQTATMQTNFNDRINAMSQSIAGDTGAFQGYMAKKSAEFDAYLKQLMGLPTGGGYGHTPGRALGGPVLGGSAYLVGERGPELFTPRVNGNIFPNGLTEAMLRGGRGGTGKGQSANINITLQSSALTAQQMRREINASRADLLNGLSAALQAV